MDRIEGQVRRELGRFGPRDDATGADMIAIVRAWPAVVGETVARNAWPARLARDGTLQVNASSSTWAFELGHMAAEILARLREEVGEAAPPTLRFAAGPIPAPAALSVAERAPIRPQVRPEDAAEAAGLAAAIEDEELRALVERAAAASLARARSSRAF
jgi:hypothetical protein